MLATASALLKKIESTPVKPAKKVALAYSGGLDSSLCVALAHHKYQVEQLIAVTVDVGQGKEEICQELGIPITEVMQGGDDKTLWCRSLASGAIRLQQQIPDHAWIWWKPLATAPDKPTTIAVTFEQGIPVSLNGKALGAQELIAELNILAGQHGIGKSDIFEDGIMGLKSRELYEAPAATVLLKLHHDMEQFCPTKEEVELQAGAD